MTSVVLQTQLSVVSELPLAAGFKNGTSSTMTSRTMMLAELRLLLAALLDNRLKRFDPLLVARGEGVVDRLGEMAAEIGLGDRQEASRDGLQLREVPPLRSGLGDVLEPRFFDAEHGPR